MKKILTLAFLGMLSFSAFSQKGTSFSVGLEAGMPMGTFGDGNKLGLGGSVKAAFPAGDKGAFTASAGYISFGAKDVVIPAITFGGVVIMPEQTISGASFATIPVKVGYRYMLSDAFSVEPQVGYTSYTGGGAFTYAAGVGYKFSDALDLGVRYESLSATGASLSFIGFRLGYSFGGK
jgi:hypothetical protein